MLRDDSPLLCLFDSRATFGIHCDSKTICSALSFLRVAGIYSTHVLHIGRSQLLLPIDFDIARERVLGLKNAIVLFIYHQLCKPPRYCSKQYG